MVLRFEAPTEVQDKTSLESEDSPKDGTTGYLGEGSQKIPYKESLKDKVVGLVWLCS